MKETIQFNFNRTEYSVEVTGNVDKTDGFIYYTFEFDGEHSVTISKFDGEKWKMVHMTDQHFFAEKLGVLLDEMR